MANHLLLKLLDGSSKECEVTGREMGGEKIYEIPLALLKPGLLEWPTNLNHPSHSIIVEETGEDYVKLRVGNVARSYTTYTLHCGDSESSRYCYGEWSYWYRISLEEADEAKIATFSPEYALAEAIANEKTYETHHDFYKVKESYQIAARLGSPEAYAWLVKDALTRVMSLDNPKRELHPAKLYEAIDLVEEACAKGVGQLAQEVFDKRETFYVVDGVLHDIFRGGETLVVPENVTTIASYAFSMCRYKINKLVIPPSVAKIESYAFMDCKMVEKVEIQGPLKLGESVFVRCRSLKRLTLAPGIDFHKDKHFSNNMKVKVIRLS